MLGFFAGTDKIIHTKQGGEIMFSQCKKCGKSLMVTNESCVFDMCNSCRGSSTQYTYRGISNVKPDKNTGIEEVEVIRDRYQTTTPRNCYRIIRIRTISFINYLPISGCSWSAFKCHYEHRGNDGIRRRVYSSRTPRHTHTSERN